MSDMTVKVSIKLFYAVSLVTVAVLLSDMLWYYSYRLVQRVG